MAIRPHTTITFESRIGTLRLGTTDTHLVEVKLRAPDLPDGRGSEASQALARAARDEIEAFLEGHLRTFTVPVQLSGHPFQREVWNELCRIPYGATLTYSQVAERLGEFGWNRAVGGACGANPVPLVVPCHRVVAKQGLGGFGGGIEVKRWLLELEMSHRPPPRVPGAPAAHSDQPTFDPTLDRGEQQSLF
ncbi:MAG: methylated-DNA--[protein]-cysteine S-methyltransferase [Holophagales bacterium]|nr:methylated-DNA--[protein]-cysteine S-methyltransferase [Holophagales bacterium]